MRELFFATNLAQKNKFLPERLSSMVLTLGFNILQIFIQSENIDFKIVKNSN